MAFRSVPRPSSPPGAKASTERPSHAHCLADNVLGNAIPTLHRNHPTHALPTRQCRPAAHRRTYPHPDAALPMTLREQPHPPDGRTHAHIHSLSRPCARQTAGTWRYHLIRSDIQFTRADAPNPDSRFKEHTQPHPRMRPEHNKARLDRKPKRSSSCISVPAATTVTSRTLWLLWRWTVSNRRPPACKAGALPLSYTPRRQKNENFLLLFYKKEELLI
jgi:hypothetical protein